MLNKFFRLTVDLATSSGGSKRRTAWVEEAAPGIYIRLNRIGDEFKAHTIEYILCPKGQEVKKLKAHIDRKYGEFVITNPKGRKKDNATDSNIQALSCIPLKKSYSSSNRDKQMRRNDTYGQVSRWKQSP